MSDETKIFTKNDKNGDKCASGGQESGLKLIFERGVAILVRPWRFPGQPKKFVFFSIKVGTINSGTSLDSREQFKKTGKLEYKMKMMKIKDGTSPPVANGMCVPRFSSFDAVSRSICRTGAGGRGKDQPCFDGGSAGTGKSSVHRRTGSSRVGSSGIASFKRSRSLRR